MANLSKTLEDKFWMIHGLCWETGECRIARGSSNPSYLKELEQYKLIHVWTVQETNWANSPAARTYFKVMITESGHGYAEGKLEPQKDCSLEGNYPSSWPKCKRHNATHTEEEVRVARSKQESSYLR